MVGLHSGTHSRLAVIGGILTIAVADAFSDALGIHLSEEAEGVHVAKEVWEATLLTFISKFLFASTFLLPFLLLDLSMAILVSVAWGLLLLAAYSSVVAREQGRRPLKVMAEHIAVALTVVLASHELGDLINHAFNG